MMDRDSLFYELSLNRELDFSVAGIKLFLSPYPKSEESIFDLWDNTNTNYYIQINWQDSFVIPTSNSIFTRGGRIGKSNTYLLH